GEVHHLQLDNAEHDAGGDARIDGIAAGFEDLESGLGCQVMTGNDYMLRADNVRPLSLVNLFDQGGYPAVVRWDEIISAHSRRQIAPATCLWLWVWSEGYFDRTPDQGCAFRDVR